jgi:hypothetical protein
LSCSFFISVEYLRHFTPSPFIRHFTPLLSFGISPSLLSFGISLFVSAKLGGLEMPLPLRPAIFALIVHFCRIFAAVFLPFPLCTFRASLREPIVPIGAFLCPLRGI